LEKVGSYLVFEEYDVVNAHESARKFRPDVILLDVIMPIRDGGEVPSQLRRDSELQNTPVIS
jgi:two-component system alkaline phosphatase synthesis response regulator PhoP